jgi:arginyl-tRNA synthetase
VKRDLMKKKEEGMPRSRVLRTSLEFGLAAIKVQDMAAKRCILRRRHGNIPTICAVRLTSLTRKNLKLLPAPTRTDRRRDTSTTARGAGHRVPAGHVSGRGAEGTAHARAKWGGHVCVPPILSAWETVVVKGETDVERTRARMWLYFTAWDVLGAAMRFLRIRPLE